MMYITNAHGYSATVHCPSNMPFFPHKVVDVQADGDELEYIRSRFKNLPDAPEKRVVTWYGDHAKFIVANW